MNCKNCGFPLTNENEKCPSCGTPNEMFTGVQPAMPVQNINQATEVPTVGSVVPETPSVPVAPTPGIPEVPSQVTPEVTSTPANPIPEVQGTQPVTAEPIRQMQSPEPVYNQPPKSKKGKIIAIIVISVVALLTLIGVGIVIAFSLFSVRVSNNTEPETEIEPVVKKKDFIWTIVERKDNLLIATYNKGIEDNFTVYGTTSFGDIAKSIEDNVKFNDSFGNVITFDVDMFRVVSSLVVMGADEYEKMDLKSIQKFEYMWAYLASLSFEFYNDNFEPETVIYDGDTNDYYFYGPIDKHNIGNLVLSFGNGQVYDEAQCGDNIYWKYNFGEPTVFYLGLDKDNLTRFEVPNMETFAGYMAGAIDKEVDK